MQNPWITGNFQHLAQSAPSSSLKHFIYLYLLSLCKSGYFRVFCYYRNTHRSGRCNSLPLSSHPPVVVLTAMTFSGSIGLPLRREGLLGNVSCLLAATASSQYTPISALWASALLYSYFLCHTIIYLPDQRQHLDMCCFSALVMPVNTCITGSATVTWAVSKLPTNHSPVSLRLLCYGGDHRNEWRIPEYSRISSAQGTMC